MEITLTIPQSIVYIALDNDIPKENIKDVYLNYLDYQLGSSSNQEEDMFSNWCETEDNIFFIIIRIVIILTMFT